MLNKLVSFAIDTSESIITFVQLVEYFAYLTLYFYVVVIKIILGNLNLLDFSIFEAIDESM